MSGPALPIEISSGPTLPIEISSGPALPIEISSGHGTRSCPPSRRHT
jgi:hypothetical protein